MKNKHLLPLVTVVALLMITATGYSQNVGIGQNTPASKLDVKGNLTVGLGYSGTAAPTNGAIIQGNVGIGTTSPSALLTIGISAPVTVDNSGNVTISSFSSGSIVSTGTGGLLQLVTAPTTNTYLEWNGTAYTWATAAASLANLTPGAGLNGSAYNGSGAQTWNVTYGSSLGTSVQGNTTLTVSPGTGMSGGGTITLGTGGTVSLTNTGILSIGVTSPIASTGGANPTISLGTVGVANGGTGLTSIGGNGTVLEVVSGSPSWQTITAASTNAWGLSGNGSTTAGTNYIGTTDGNDLVFKTNASENMRLSNSTGNVVIGSGEGGSAVGNIIRAPYNNSGGNRTGADFTIAAGAPTGKGGSGSIVFQELAANVGSSGSTSDLSIMAEAMRITNTGALSFGSTGTATGNGNNVLISGGSTTNPSWGQLNLADATNAVTGTLAATNGGTGQSSYTIGNILYASSATALSKTNAAAAGEVLIGNGTTPTFTTLSGDIGTVTSAGAVTVDGILGKTISPTTLSNTDVLEYNGTNWVPTIVQAPITLTTTGTSGAATFSSNTLNIPQYQAAGTYVTGLSVTTNQGVSGSFTAGATPALTVSLGALTGAASYNGLVVTANTGVITTGTWNGTAIGVTHGGTGLTTAPTNGQLLIGNSSGGYTLATLSTSGSGISVTNTSGVITLANTGVTSVGLSLPGIFTVSVPTVTTTGTLTATLASETANTIFAAPNGSAGTPTFRSLFNADFPTSGVTAGTYNNVTVNAQGITTGGSNVSYVTSVGASTPLSSSGGTTPSISLTGTVPVGNGGTGLTSYTTGSLLDASATTTVGQINDVTAGSYLRSAGAGVVPVWSTMTLPNAATIGDILYDATTTNAIGNLSDIATGNVLLSGGVGAAPSYGKVALTTAVSGVLPVANGGTNLSTAPSNGQLLIGNGSGYTLGTITAGTGISIANTAGSITITNTGGASSGWSLTGNGSTTPGTDYVGTSDPTDLVFKTGGTEDMRIDNTTTNLVLGSGDGTATVTGNTLRAPNITGTNKTGPDLTITSGDGTGTGGSGNVIFQTAPASGTSSSTANTMTEAMRINSAGNVGFGTNAPATQVDINGNLAIRNLVVTGASGTYTLNPNGYSFIELQSTGNFTLNTISGGVNGEILIVWNSPTSGHTMTLGTTGNIKEYTSAGGTADIITLIYSSAHSEWVMTAAQ